MASVTLIRMSGEFFVYHRPLVAGLSCSDLVGSYASGSMNNILCLLLKPWEALSLLCSTLYSYFRLTDMENLG